MTEKEKMLAGLPYNSFDGELVKMSTCARDLCIQLNSLPYSSKAERAAIIRKLFGKCGKNIDICAGFYCDYGCNIEVGENFFCNYNVVILDVCKVKIGDNCFIAPQVGIYTACHPLDGQERLLYEMGKPITIGNNCWIGGNAVINPGVTLGNNVTVGSGSVVTKSFPSDVVIAGNPAKIIRYLK
ncbi:MAG: sugar O-acetyltransferase [Clostridia bacterium]|nr:sugar O-acetyltransferase [Clostridia bacterium]